MRKILITGGLGQIGADLVIALQDVYKKENIIVTDINEDSTKLEYLDLKFEQLDILDSKRLGELVDKYSITYIIHLVSILSARGEENPAMLWNINMNGLYNVLEVAREKKLGVFVPSSIASFGPNTPPNMTPQDTLQRPNTIYGISKVAGELLCDYYHNKFAIDIRGLRFPGLVSYKALPGGGTTDYAVSIYYDALKHKKFVCPLKEDTYMDMMYMSDATDAVIKLIEADDSKLKHRNAFNISSMSICPKDIYLSIKKVIPQFEISYNVNSKLQSIADSWPNSLDIKEAQLQWGFNPKINLDEMTKIMLSNIKI